MAVDYTYQSGTGSQTTEYVSSYKNVVTPTTGSATNVEYTYTYDANGNIVSDSLGGTLKHSYVYDEAGQLVRVNDAVQNKTFCYTYDNGGNLIYKKRYAYTTGTLGSVLQTMGTYAYGDSNWKDKLTSYNNISLSYDAIGNLTNFDDRSFTWTAGRQLAGFELNTDDYAVTYKYNADGLRTQKYIDDDQTYTDTTYDYIWADGKLISQTDGTDVLYFLYDSSDSPIGFVLNDAETYLYIKNLQGDITGIADENGAIIVNYTYDEWGKLLSTTGSEADTIGLLNPLRYRGYYYDTETGYYYLQSRYYNPSWGRFINADVYCHTGTGVIGTNMYAYCDNNPVNFYDITGCASSSILFYNPDFVTQARWMAENAYKYKDVMLIQVSSFKAFVSAWETYTKTGYAGVKDIHLFFHGGPGRLYWKNETINLKQITDNLKPTTISGKIYLFSCQGGTTSEGQSVAGTLAKIVPYTYVRAVVNGNVYYRAWNQIFSRKPLTKEQNAYWADFYFGNRQGQMVLSISYFSTIWNL